MVIHAVLVFGFFEHFSELFFDVDAGIEVDSTFVFLERFAVNSVKVGVEASALKTRIINLIGSLVLIE